MNPITRKTVESNTAKFQSCWPNTCKMVDNKRQMYGSQSTHVFGQRTVLKLGCVTNLDTLFLVMGFISLVDEIQFMLISRHHIYIRSLNFHIGRGPVFLVLVRQLVTDKNWNG